MSARTHRRRSRLAAALGATAVLALGAVVAGGPSPSAVAAPAADPTADCATAHPVDELVAGQPVAGLTVDSGTVPEPFTGTVLGVLENGIAPGLDMVITDLDSDALDAAGGIWQGMSGSPVYATDGRLIGAVAYGLSYGPSPIAGVTPFADMAGHRDRVPARIRLDGRAARALAADAGISVARARQGFDRLRVPVGISGVSARRLEQVSGKRAYLTRGAHAVGSSSASADAGTIVAGGNMAASLAYGDITMAGVGTATSVCAGRVVGFGHPFSMLGSTTLALHPADAIYVQPDSLGAPFKVANIGAPVGTVTDDRATGIAASFGAVPDGAEVSSTVTYGARSRTGETEVFVPPATAEATFYQVLTNHDRVLDGDRIGSELMAWTITGSDERGRPYALSLTNRHEGAGGVEEAAFRLGDVLWALGNMPKVAIDAVTITSDVTPDTSALRVRGIEQRRGGAWVPVSRKEPAQVRAGNRLHLRVLLRGPDTTHTFPVKVKLPRAARSARVQVLVSSGLGSWLDTSFETVAAARTALGAVLRNDQLRVQVGTPDRVGIGAGAPELDGRAAAPGRVPSFLRTRTSAPFEATVRGQRKVRVVVTP